MYEKEVAKCVRETTKYSARPADLTESIAHVHGSPAGRTKVLLCPATPLAAPTQLTRASHLFYIILRLTFLQQSRMQKRGVVCILQQYERLVTQPKGAAVSAMGASVGPVRDTGSSPPAERMEHSMLIPRLERCRVATSSQMPRETREARQSKAGGARESGCYLSGGGYG